MKLGVLKEPNVSMEIDRIPDACPLCHTACVPIAFGCARMDNGGLTGVFQCPVRKCNQLFLGFYAFKHSGSTYILQSVTPVSPKTTAIAKNVQAVSPQGAKLLTQAESALALGLESAAGPAFRKALEFFIKDFLISKNPSDAEEIKKAALGHCVNTMVDNENLKRAAQRAVWLGNDEVHYERLWNTHDLEDLRRLLHIAIIWIDSDLTLAEYEKEMPAKKPA